MRIAGHRRPETEHKHGDRLKAGDLPLKIRTPFPRNPSWLNLSTWSLCTRVYGRLIEGNADIFNVSSVYKSGLWLLVCTTHYTIVHPCPLESCLEFLWWYRPGWRRYFAQQAHSDIYGTYRTCNQYRLMTSIKQHLRCHRTCLSYYAVINWGTHYRITSIWPGQGPSSSCVLQCEMSPVLPPQPLLQQTGPLILRTGASDVIYGFPFLSPPISRCPGPFPAAHLRTRPLISTTGAASQESGGAVTTYYSS